ncbi:MAG: ZIP family metal transporter [bacterium]|nr:ZIP family metal transporter [bacterium]
MMWVYSLGAVAIVSLVAFAGLFTLALRVETLRRCIFVLVGLAIGALFGDALIHLIPEALKSGLGEVTVGVLVMSGILAFFILEKFLSWHHTHGEHEETTESIAEHDHAPKTLAPLVLAADFIHNSVDGIIIGASFLVSVPVGIATTVAVVLHEIPQEVADFGLLIHAGWSRGRALLWNFLTALSAFIGVLFVLLFGSSIEQLVPVAASITAGAFLYIAGTDLVPELQRTPGFKKSLIQILSIALGFFVMVLLTFLE